MEGTAEKRSKWGFHNVPRRVKLVIYLTCFSAIGIGYLMTYISAYLPEIGFSSEDVGLIIAAFSLSTILCAIPLGMLSDRWERKRVLVIGLAFFPPILIVYAFSTDMTLLLVGALIGGAAEGAFLTTWNALIADQTTLENRNSAFALSFIVFTSFSGIGYALPLIFPLIESLTGWSSLSVHSGAFVVIAVLTAITPVGMFVVLRNFHEHHEHKPKARLDVKRMGNLWKFSVINSLIGLGAGFIISLIPTWLFLKFGVLDSFSGPLLAIAGITMAFASLASARIAFRYGPVRAIALTQGASTLFLVLIPFMPGPGLAGLAFIIRSMLMNMSGPIADSFLMSIIPKEQRGLASAINNIVWRLPNSVTTVFGGMLLAAGFYNLPFYITTVCYVVAIGLFYITFKNTKLSA